VARSERQVPAVYFGRPGALIQLPWPLGDMEKPYGRKTFVFETGAGQSAVSTLSTGGRVYNLHWNALHLDNYSLLDQYWSGGMGIGPWAFIDPSIPNLLLPNQAGATSLYSDSTGLKTVGGALADGTILSNTSATFIHRTGAPRSVRWQFTTAASTTPQLTFTAPYRNWFGVPAMTGLPYAFSLWARPDGTVDSSITMAAKIQWMDATGATLSTSTGGDIVVGAAFTKLTVTATAPANTAYAMPYLNAIGSTITTGASIYADEFLFEQDSVFNNWAPGKGCRPVEIVSLADVVPFETRMRRAVDATLMELAA